MNPKIFYRAFLVPFVMRLVNISDTLSLSVETRGFSLEKVPYTVYKKGSREIAVNKKLNSHLAVKSVFVSLYQIVVFTKESGGVHSQIALFDQNGEKISFEEIGEKKGSWEQKIYARRGRVITKLYGYVTTADNLKLYRAKTRKEAKNLSKYQFCVDIL